VIRLFCRISNETKMATNTWSNNRMFTARSVSLVLTFTFVEFSIIVFWAFFCLILANCFKSWMTLSLWSPSPIEMRTTTAIANWRAPAVCVSVVRTSMSHESLIQISSSDSGSISETWSAFWRTSASKLWSSWCLSSLW